MYEFMLACQLLIANTQAADLGNPRFHVREECYRRLYEGLPGTLPAVLMGCVSRDPEVAWRAGRLLTRAYPALKLWKWVMNPAARELMTADRMPDASVQDAVTVADLWQINNLVVPNQSSWASREGEVRWCWEQGRKARNKAVDAWEGALSIPMPLPVKLWP